VSTRIQKSPYISRLEFSASAGFHLNPRQTTSKCGNRRGTKMGARVRKRHDGLGKFDTIPNKTEAAYRRGKLLKKRRGLMDEWALHCSLNGYQAERTTRNDASVVLAR
jgi:hypothetical protein